MAITLTLANNIQEGEENPWLKEGIQGPDKELAEECGLLTPREMSDFDKMIEEEEEFLNDGLDIVDELEAVIDQGDGLFENEIIHPGKVYENIPVRITMKKETFAIGAIDGNSSVYISCGLMKSANLTIGSIHMTNLIYKPSNQNVWKAIYIHPKIDPVLVNEFSSNGINFSTFHVPKQDLGKMIGKSGICIQKILNDIVYNYPSMKKAFNGDIVSDIVMMDGEGVPKLDINNFEDYTEIKVWDNPGKRCIPTTPTCGDNVVEFDVIEDFAKKMYC